MVDPAGCWDGAKAEADATHPAMMSAEVFMVAVDLILLMTKCIRL